MTSPLLTKNTAAITDQWPYLYFIGANFLTFPDPEKFTAIHGQA